MAAGECQLVSPAYKLWSKCGAAPIILALILLLWGQGGDVWARPHIGAKEGLDWASPIGHNEGAP